MPIIADNKKRKQIVALLAEAYWTEIETVMNTQDMVVTIRSDEQEHLREFEGFLEAYERK